MVIWPSKALLIAVHDRQLSEHNGSSGIRDDSLLESALARPQQLLAYGGNDIDLADLAASLAFRLARNHPFVDGNKRTAYVAFRVFLKLNGADFQASQLEKFQTFLALAEGELSESELAIWLRERMTGPKIHRVQESSGNYSV